MKALEWKTNSWYSDSVSIISRFSGSGFLARCPNPNLEDQGLFFARPLPCYQSGMVRPARDWSPSRHTSLAPWDMQASPPRQGVSPRWKIFRLACVNWLLYTFGARDSALWQIHFHLLSSEIPAISNKDSWSNNRHPRSWRGRSFSCFTTFNSLLLTKKVMI